MIAHGRHGVLTILAILFLLGVMFHLKTPTVMASLHCDTKEYMYVYRWKDRY